MSLEIKTASKKAIQKTVKTTGDLIGNKITDKIAKKSLKKLHSQNNLEETKNEIERYIFPKKRHQITKKLTLV